MIVCSCNRISDRSIRDRLDAAPNVAARVSEVFDCLGCRPQCGRCAGSIRAILRENGTGDRACAAAIDDLRRCATAADGPHLVDASTAAGDAAIWSMAAE